MNLEKLKTERLVKDFIGGDQFIKYEVGLINLEEYYKRLKEEAPQLFIPEILLDIESNDLSERVVVLNYSPTGEINVGTLMEWYEEEKLKLMLISSDLYKLQVVSIKDFVEASKRTSGKERVVYDYSAKTYLEIIFNEAAVKKALEVTIVSEKEHTAVYYNMNLSQEKSPLKIPKSITRDIVEAITTSTKTHVVGEDNKSIQTYVNVSAVRRGRVQIDSTFYGYLITIRFFDLRESKKTVDDLGYLKGYPEILRKAFQNKRPGLKIVAGPTLSGKNTLIMALLAEYLDRSVYKCVSVEKPVEQIHNRIIQINCETDTQYKKAVYSLVRHNPDIVYFTEINDYTGSDILRTANTGKTVFSTVHANSVIDVLTRLQDITGMSIRRIVMLIDTIVYQRLLFSEKNFFPALNYVMLDEMEKRKINMLPDDESIFKFISMKTSSFQDYMNELIEKGCITEEVRNECT